MQNSSLKSETDPREFTDEELSRVLKRVGEEARRKAFAAGRPITVLEGSQLVRIWADGRREVVPDRAAVKERL